MPRLPSSTAAMMSASIRNPTRHDRRVVTKPPIRGPIAAAIAAGRTDQREDLGARLPFEVAVDQRLHRGEIERGAEPAEDRPEDDDRRQALREHHRERPDGVEHHAHDERALAAVQVTDLAADQDERSGHERLDRHGRLDPAHRRVEIVDDRRDRHVHERRVDHEHEHRGRQKDALPRDTSRALGLIRTFHSRERTASGCVRPGTRYHDLAGVTQRRGRRRGTLQLTVSDAGWLPVSPVGWLVRWGVGRRWWGRSGP